jgi:Ca-activated chloride channel homolog
VSFLAPFGFALLALGLPLVLLYFVRVRRRQRKVSSVLLWQPELRDRTSSSFFQRLERDPLLLLQLLALVALALALARPTVTVLGEGERKVVVVLDTSASMKARDVSPNRFEEARDRASAFVGGLREGTHVMVIEAGIQPRVSAPMARDRGAALDAINAASARDLPNRLDEAIRTALGLIGTDELSEIHVFTDGAFAQLPGPADGRIRWTAVGRGGDNVGITNLSVRKSGQGASSYEALLSLANFSTKPRSFAFTLKVDDRTVAEREVTLGANVRRSLIVPFRHTGAARVTAQLRIEDDLAVDDVAYAVLPPANRIAVTLVSEGNLFLEKVLRANPEVQLDVRSPAQYAGGMGSADVVVLDSVTPAKVGPGRFIFVNTVPPDLPVDLLGTQQNPTVVDWDRSHPIMRHVEFSKVAIQSALRVRPVAPGRALVEAAVGGPLMYALEEPDRKALLVGFDLFQADFPLRVAFPLIMSNALRWLHPSGFDHSSLQVAVGEPLLMPVAHGVDAVNVTTPSGRNLPGRVTRSAASFADTGEVGVYTLSTGRGELRVAANLMDGDESNIAPRPLPASPAEETSESVPVEREIWRALLALAILLLLLEGLLYWRRQSGGRLRLPDERGDRHALAARACVLAVLGVAFMRPAFPHSVDRLNVAFLLDQSDSISHEARERAQRFVDEAVQHSKPGDQHSIIVFGAEASIAQPLTTSTATDATAREIDGKKSNIFNAVQLALAMLPVGQTNRLILLSDGRQNTGNALAAAQAAKDSGADLHYVAAPLTFQQEVVAEALVVPREVRFGEPFQARLVAWSQKDTPARLSLFRNGQFIGSQQVKMVAGKNVFSYRQALDKDGIHVYQAAIEVDGDTIEDNNRAVGTVLVRGRPQVLIVDRDRTHAQALASALRAQQLEITITDPSGIPSDMAALRKFDGVVLSNVSAIQLNPAHMTRIRDYVRDFGGGLIMVGGDQSFGLGGYYQTPIEEALPVTMEVKQRVDVPNLSIVLSIDRSDSMTTRASGNVTYLDLAKEAAHLVVDLVDENSEVGVMSWDTEYKWDAALRQAKNKQLLHNAIGSIVSGGGTDGYPALREAYNVLSKRPALLKHVIFLTDGQMRREQFQDLIERMAREQITVSSVAVGKWSDEKLLQSIAQWGRGRYYKTEDSQSLPRIFAVETQLASNNTVVDQPFRPRLIDTGHEATQDIDWKSMPPLGGYVATTAKSNAEQVLVSHWEDPVLATWRYGLGRAAAFTSDANSRWSQQWQQWREFNKFWAQLVRWTLRSGSAEGTTASVERRDGIGEVIVEAVDPKGRFVNFLEPQVGIVSPDKERTVIDLEQVAPGRYVGRFPAAQEGVYLVGMAQRPDQPEPGSQLSALVVPYAQELRELGVDEGFLKEIAELTGGGALTEAREVFLKSRRPYDVLFELWSWLVGLGAALLLADIALRRLGAGFFVRAAEKMRAGGRGATSDDAAP